MICYNIVILTTKGEVMVTTVRLDKDLENKLNNLANVLQKKKSDIIREAIEQYSNSIEKVKKSRLQMAVEKTKDIDKKEFTDFEGTTYDGI